MTVPVNITARLIPAHAGKTVHHLGRDQRYEAHPRSLGENTMVRTEASAEFGSSPLTRGKLDDNRHHLALLGLIPAHAGKTVFEGHWQASSSAHPRSRGENIRGIRLPVTDRGSSPLTRGKLRGCLA